MLRTTRSAVRPAIRAVIIISMLCGLAIPVMAETVPALAIDQDEWALSVDPNDRMAFAGKPVSLLAGMEVFKRSDLTLGNLFPIEIVREFNGRSGYDSPLGYGWAFTFDKRLYTYPDGSVIVREGYGKKRKFEHAWIPGSGDSLVIVITRIPCSESGCLPIIVVDKTLNLESNADSTYTVTTQHGDKDHYDIFGRLSKMEDRNGNSLVFYYELDSRSPLWGLLPSNVNQNTSLAVANDYRVSRIEEQDASGGQTNRYVLFHYDSSTGRLNDIVDSNGRTVTYSHDNIGNMTGVSGPSGIAAYGFTDATFKHKMTGIDEGQGAYTNTYDPQGRITRQTHGTGVIDMQYTVQYTEPYRKTTVTTTIKDASGNISATDTRTVIFDTMGRIESNTDVNGNMTIFQSNYYNEKTAEYFIENIGTPSTPNLVQRNSTDYTYDNTANMLSKREAVGTSLQRLTLFTYDPAFNLVSSVVRTSVVDQEQQNVISNGYDAHGNLLTTTETGLLGNGSQYNDTTTYTYYPSGRLWTINGPRSDVQDITTFTYTSQGDIQSITHPLIGMTTYSDHDGLGNPQTVTDPNGNITTYTYDTTGRVATVKSPGDTNATQIVYVAGGCSSCGGAASNKIDHITLPEGNTISFSYDANGNLIRISDTLGNSINYTYDSERNRLSEEIRDSGGSLQKTLNYQYDSLNHLVKATNPDSTYSQYSYDFLGRRTGARNPNANTTTYQYDALNRLTAVTQPGTVNTGLGYNTNDNLTTVTDANGNVTTYKYDDKGRVYQVISPDTGTTTYTYDPAGNLTSKTDAKSIVISYIYDDANRLTSIASSAVGGLSTFSISYVYDTCLNGKGRLCTMTDASGTTSYEYTTKGQVKKETKLIDSVNYITQYTYDQNGNMKTMTYPSGKVISYNYSNDRAISVLNGAATIATSIAYKPFGGMSSITYGNGIVSSIGYDTQYHLSTLVTSTFQNLTYGYDNNGNITSIAPGKSYTYDALDRIGTATGPWGSLGWTYDGVGNRQTENGNGYAYDPNSNRLARANGISFGYDNNGNTTTEATRIYTYNQNQRLIQVTDGAMSAGYTYNGNGQRVKKSVNGTVTIFHYNLSGQIIAESNSTGTITAEYVYLNGQPLAKMEGTNTYYYHNDHLGTPQKMTDASGVVVWSADYKPFGEANVIISTITNNLRFPGQYFDAETGNHYNYYRDYNPVLDRYIQADPIGLRGGINIYAYALVNPLYWFDPYGLTIFVAGSAKDLVTQLQAQLSVIDAAVAKMLSNYKEAYVIATTGGNHNKGSVHGCGRAVDIRIWDKPDTPPADLIEKSEKGWITSAQADQLISQLQKELGNNYEIRNERLRPAGQEVWSGPHIHIQYNP